MARVRRLDDLRTDVRKAANVESHTTQLPNSEITEYVNKGIERYNNIVRRSRGAELTKQKSTATTSAGVSAIAFASFSPSLATLANIVQVYAIVDADEYELTRVNPEERPILENAQAAWSGRPLYYDRRQSTIDILPAPDAGYTIAVWWAAGATRLVNDADEFDGVDGWENLVIKWAAREVCRKTRDAQTHAMLSAEIAEAIDEIQGSLVALDSSGPPRVRDVRGTAGPVRDWRRSRWR